LTVDITDEFLKLLKKFQFDDVIAFFGEMIAPPSRGQIDYAIEKMQLWGIVENKMPTPFYSKVISFPLELADSIVMLAAADYGVATPIAKFLAMRDAGDNLDKFFLDIRENDKRFGDFIKSKKKWANSRAEVFSFIDMFSKYLNESKREQWCNKHFIKHRKMEIAQKGFIKILNKVKLLPKHEYIDFENSEKADAIIRALQKGYKKNIATADSGFIYNIKYPCKKVTIEMPMFLKKMSKEILFLDIMEIKGSVKVGCLINL
jgi:HrpA-like RNA helicase